VPAAAVTANTLHLGVAGTLFGADDPAMVQRLLVPLLRPFMKTPNRGPPPRSTWPPNPDLARVTGRLFTRSRPRKSSERSYDRAVATRLRQASADLVDADSPVL
jgi:hypothetical protein